MIGAAWKGTGLLSYNFSLSTEQAKSLQQNIFAKFDEGLAKQFGIQCFEKNCA